MIRVRRLTAREWHASPDPERLLMAMRDGPPADRQLVLFAAACCRRVWHLMADDRARHCVETAERFFDGLASRAEWAEAGRAARDAWADSADPWAGESPGQTAARMALHAATTAAHHLGPDGLRGQPGLWAFAVAVATSIEAARAVLPRYTDSPERPAQADLLRDIVGDPFEPVTFDPAWVSPLAVDLARGIYDGDAFDRLPVLADALEEAGCADTRLLTHCRSGGTHVRGCWAVDGVLGR